MVRKLLDQSSVKITKNYKILVLLGLNTVHFFCEGKYANCLNDEKFLQKLSNDDFIVKEIRCYGFCMTEYQTRAKKTPKGTRENKLVYLERSVLTSF